MGYSISPLRYPGGKHKYWRLFRSIFEKNKLNVETFIEPFSGGAGLGFGLLHNSIVNQIILNEKDELIYNFWKVLFEKPNRLIHMIQNEVVSVEQFKIWREVYRDADFKNSLDDVELAFAFFFVNRVTRSGIYKAGVIGGYDQTGNYPIDARFKRDSIKDKIEYLYTFKNKVNIYNYDYLELHEEVLSNSSFNNIENSIIYLDPPYFKIGKNLYHQYFKEKHHNELRNYLQSSKNGNWILSYNKTEEILKLYKNFNIYNSRFTTSISTNVVKDELLILSENIKLPNGKYGNINIRKIS